MSNDIGRPQLIDPSEIASLPPGTLVPHCDDENDTTPSAYSIPLGDDRILWVGDITDQRFEEIEDDLGNSGGYWLVLYEADKTHVLLKFASREIAMRTAEIISSAILFGVIESELIAAIIDGNAFKHIAKLGMYLIWSNEHRAWWRPLSAGYTRERIAAGRYSRESAIRISRQARDGWRPGEPPPELPVRLYDVLKCEKHHG